mgnify:CR=1 FL=1
MDKILDQMDAIQADPDQSSKYMDLAAQAVDIYLRDIPEIMLTEELHVVTANTTYWTGFMNKADPYAAPYPVLGGVLPGHVQAAADRRLTVSS